MEEALSCVGFNSVIALGMDDKAKVPLGIPAAMKQSPIIMGFTYFDRVKLDEHDFPVAPGYKLLPSVYGFFGIKDSLLLGKDERPLQYSGPTFVKVR